MPKYASSVQLEVPKSVPYKVHKQKIYDVTEDFELGADQLKIQFDACAGGQASDLLVMLERIQCKDLNDPENVFEDLIEQRKQEEPSRGQKLWSRMQDQVRMRKISGLKRAMTKSRRSISTTDGPNALKKKNTSVSSDTKRRLSSAMPLGPKTNSLRPNRFES